MAYRVEPTLLYKTLPAWTVMFTIWFYVSLNDIHKFCPTNLN